MKIRSIKDLEVYKLSFSSAMKIYELAGKFPNEETYSLTDQIRRSSRSVSSNIAEAFRKRRYPESFISMSLPLLVPKSIRLGMVPKVRPLMSV
jgi:hypothetical protein